MGHYLLKIIESTFSGYIAYLVIDYDCIFFLFLQLNNNIDIIR